MSKSLLLSSLASLASLPLLASATGCMVADEDCEDVTLLGGCADNGSGYYQPSPPSSVSAPLGDGASCPGQANYRCSVAVSGTDTIAVGPNSASDLQVGATGGFSLTALPTAPVQPLAYLLRAPDAERQGSLELDSSNLPTVSEVVQAHAVYDVTVVASDGDGRYSRDNATVRTSNSRFVVALWSNEDSGLNPPYEPSRLVDTSLRSESPFVEQLSWDTFVLSAAPGMHQLAFTSDSMGSFVLEVEVVNQ